MDFSNNCKLSTESRQVLIALAIDDGVPCFTSLSFSEDCDYYQEHVFGSLEYISEKTSWCEVAVR